MNFKEKLKIEMTESTGEEGLIKAIQAKAKQMKKQVGTDKFGESIKDLKVLLSLYQEGN